MATDKLALAVHGRYKVVLLGEQSVGKSAIVNRFMFENFDEGYQGTIGVDFLARTIRVGSSSYIRIQIWDTAGQERFHSLIPAYIRDCHAAIIVYDITNLESFDWVDKWVDDVRRCGGQATVLAIVGNKEDLNEIRQVPVSAGEAKAKQHEAMFFEASAKFNRNISDLFQIIGERCHALNSQTQKDQILTQTVELANQDQIVQKREPNEKKKCNC